ncbi:MAG TPA: 30S ribosomal protein S1 [Terriglobia bacterium]|nr:30S ribosomal protein S1 [Terriglobia bacterium]
MSSDENSGSLNSTETMVATREEIAVPPLDSGTLPEVRVADPGPPQIAEVTPGAKEETAPSSSNGAAVPEMQIELPNITPEASDSAEIDTMLADMEKLAAVPQGKVVAAKVLKVTELEVRLSVGTNLEGVVPLAEFVSPDGQLTVAPGDEVGVWVDRYNEKQGTVTISRQKAARLEVWEKIEQAFQEKRSVTGRVLDRIKGGLTVDIGIHAFMPSSQADLRPLRNVDALLGQEITCKIIKLIRKRSNVVVSRKEAMEEESNHRKAELVEKLKEGLELTGRVKNLTEYGAFVDLGGLDGLLHITDMSWGRVGHPSEVVQAGQEIKVKVLKFDTEKGRVSLGLKQLHPDPWATVPAAYHVGDRVSGRVANVTDYGAFVELAPGIEGLIHVSEMSWSKRPKHPSKIMKPGDHAEVAVLGVDPAQRRISLSLKQTLPDPWEALVGKYSAGMTVEGTVSNLTDFGAFAEIDSDMEGLIRNADLSWTKKVKHPSEVVKKGQKIKAVVLNVDAEHRRLALGVKQLQTDPWDGFCIRIRVGDLVKAKVARMAPFGAFVEIEEGIEGLCHTSEFGDKKDTDGKAKLEIGREMEFRVLRLDPMERKISLSLKPAPAPPPPRGNKRTEWSSGKSAPAPAMAEAKRRPEPTTAMGEALSAAGITSSRMREHSAPKAQRKPEPAHVEPAPGSPEVKVEEQASVVAEVPSPAVKAEPEATASASEPSPAVLAESGLAAASEEPVHPDPAAKAQDEPSRAAPEAAPEASVEEKTAVAGDGIIS